MSTSDRARSATTRAGRQAEHTGRQVEGSRAFSALVTIGLLAYGVVHLLVAWIALQLAWSGSNQQASQQGAFREMASTSVGGVLIWITAVGLFALALWQIFEAVWGHRDADEGRKRVFKRLGSASKAVVYLTLGVSAVGTASGSSSGDGNSEETLTAKLMTHGFGRVLIILLGLVVVVVGGRLVYRGITKKFTHDLDGGVSQGVQRLGQVGYTAKGIALGIVGVLFVVAAVTFDPEKAGGLDDALRTLRDQAFGPYLLTLMALGIACFGLYCFAWSRHRKDSTGR